jgi:small subunit ribosomal protein S4
MSNYRGPRLRIVRRLGRLPAFSKKIPKRYNAPGQHSEKRRTPTQFAYRLAEKQKLRFYYGISEKSTVRYMTKARKSKGATGETIVQLLEIRLDNIVYRIGLAPTLPAARQLVNHGHILVNKKCVTIPSFSCSQGQTITAQNLKTIHKWSTGQGFEQDLNIPSHLTLEKEKKIVTVNSQPDRREVPLNLNELFVVEYYSNRL